MTTSRWQYVGSQEHSVQIKSLASSIFTRNATCPRNETDEILYSRCLVFIRLETLHQIIMDGGLQCQICPYKAPRMVRLKRHMEVTHQGLRLACGFCQYTSAESSNLKKHIQRVHEHLKYTCEHCNRIFSEKHILKKHLGFVHLNKPRPIFSCNECKKEFYTREAQRRHTSTHLGISYPCEKCDYKANLLENLNRHTKAHHEEKTLYFCQSCDYKGSKKGLRVHIESKHGSKLFKCDQCEYISSRDEYLKMHVRDQHGSDIFYCNLCDYSWYSKSTLRDHDILSMYKM